MRLSKLPLLLSVLLLQPAAECRAQHVRKSVLDHIRSVSVSIDWDERCHGSGTLFDRDGETWVITANHLVEAAAGRQIRASQHNGKKAISVNAEVVRQCAKTDVALLKVGRGVFGPGVTFYNNCCPPNKGTPPGLDTAIVHCGSMAGFHHTITRGYIVGLDREIDEPSVGPAKADQADITASYGSSGGGVFLTDGRYIGMVHAGIPQRLIFFVPIRQMKLLYD